ncbi:MAG: hypothetical protein HOV80_15865 [Polyangiaceae bacterium]|nr:hypothetical protein [Polyangiaceae bacterium]
MTAAIVVCFRWGTETELSAAGQRTALRLAQQAEALGALLCAYGSTEIAVAFVASDHDEALHFAARSLRKLEPGGTIRAGVGAGELTPLFEAGRFVSLSRGEAFDCAALLSRVAEPGQVLIDSELDGAKDGSLAAPETGKVLTVSGRGRRALALDVAHPFVRESVTLYEDTFTALEDTDEVPRSPTGAFQIVDLARDALVRGDTAGLDMALKQLKLTGEHPDLAARLAGVLAMTRGAKEEGLRILRRAVEQEERDDRRARAELAYAVGLAAASRNEEALLAGLRALALTRMHDDRSGELACARFLAQLSRASGQEEPARVWESVATRASRPPPG